MQYCHCCAQALLRNIILNYPSVLRLNNKTEKQEGAGWGRKRNIVDKESEKASDRENEREHALARALIKRDT